MSSMTYRGTWSSACGKCNWRK